MWLISEPQENCCNILMAHAMDAITDFNDSSCISPFISRRPQLHMEFRVRLLDPRDSIKVIVTTNVDCNDPFTVLASRSYANCGNTANDDKIINQCELLSGTDKSNISRGCLFYCSCLGPCEDLIFQQQVLPGSYNEPTGYVTCDVRVVT